MEFIGITALIDAGVCLVAWIFLYMRKSNMAGVSDKANALSSYLLATFAFLVLIGLSILQFQGQGQAVMLMISDLMLWVSLVLFIKLMHVGGDKKNQGVLISIFLVFALLRTLFQLAGILGMDLSSLGSSLTYVLSQLDAWLMYAVWVPSAIALIALSLRSESAVVRSRSLMFAIGILLITFTWAYRLLGGADAPRELAFVLVSGVSIIGFVLLLTGVLHRGENAPAMATPSPSPMGGAPMGQM